MNVFEDLVLELQKENLLESTRMDAEPPEYGDFDDSSTAEVQTRAFQCLAFEPEPEDSTKSETEETPPPELTEVGSPEAGRMEDWASDAIDQKQTLAKERKQKQVEETPDELQKRPISEVSSLQMVEHVLTGVEREYLKIVPETFDDFSVKKALHAFLSVGPDAEREIQASAEFTLIQATEAWCTALGRRDAKIPVSSLRQYCENSRPALSSQVLVGLARFYRNSPCSEQVRAKFDFSITRFFSRPGVGDERVRLFTKEEMVEHIETFYKEWSSIPLYNADEDESKILLTALSFDDLAVEAENASTFDQLISSDFFGRLRLFKESISELFFAPTVTAAAVDSNIRIGNCFVKLIEREREKMNDASIQSKYGDLNDQAISDAAARTLKLVDLLRGRPDADKGSGKHFYKSGADRGPKSPPKSPDEKPKKKKSKDKADETRQWPIVDLIGQRIRTLNKWVLGFAITAVALSIGMYISSNYLGAEDSSINKVNAFNIDDSVLKEHIHTARLSEETLYGLLEPTWDTLSKDKRHQFLQRVLQLGKERGYTKVHLIGKDGKPAGYASPTRINVIMR